MGQQQRMEWEQPSIMTDNKITHRWSTRLSIRNTVFQAEILAILKAVEHTVALPTQQLTIHVEKQAIIQSAAKPKESPCSLPEIAP
ncbi:hypothetical protein AVEN_174293-1 [Araneus ventricosus]|uniref:RNase H type-1 domain-containing protein n=1 Tax=Araneus ventricosus TaxID=182803 RepID=A0A4Y2NA91_ARAVE|nr:hypothetical protein AVEN_174293-1 [Araneus ventricosus]